MKISYSWIKELVDIKTNPQDLALALSMAGLSVETFEEVSGDWVYTIEVTSNRPDWLSARGIVHEIVAITGAKFKKPQAARPQGKLKKSPQAPSIAIENKKDCAFYYGQVIRNIKVGPSPAWLKGRLEALGVRLVNNVVDITNYCLLELGQPLHAFDLDALKGPQILVRRAKKGESMALIDGSLKNLDERILVIADSSRPVAVAGIMGGASTEVTAKTRNVFLESACFDPVLVRRGSRALGVSSDSSYRFERGVDPETVQVALERAARMIVELCGGSPEEPVRSGQMISLMPRRIVFDLEHALDTLGVDIPVEKAKKIFRDLGFSVASGGKKTFAVTAPSFRRDIKIPEDLTEELIRIWGYERIPLTSASIKPFVLETPLAQVLEKRTRDILVAAGLKEAVTYSLISEEDYLKTGLAVPEGAFVLENPLNRDYSILRSTLVPSLLKCAASNISRNNKDLELFETASIFSGGLSGGQGIMACGVVMCGEKRASWLKEARAYSFFDLKGVLEALFEEFGLKGCSFVKSDDIVFAQAGEAARIMLGNDAVGFLCRVSAAVKKAHGIKSKDDIFVAELSLEALSLKASLKKCLAPLVVYPGVVRDVSFLAGESASYESVRAIICDEAGGLIRRVNVADVYQGKEVPQGYMSLTVSIEYGSNQKTLTDDEANSAHRKVLDALIKRLGVTIR